MNSFVVVLLFMVVGVVRTDTSSEESHESSEVSYVVVPPPLQTDPARGKRQQDQLLLYPRLLTERLYGPDISSLQTPILDNGIDGTVRFLGPARRRVGIGPKTISRPGLRTTRRLYSSRNGYGLQRNTIEDIIRRRTFRRFLRNRALRRNLLEERRLSLDRGFGRRRNRINDLLYDDFYDDYDYYDSGLDYGNDEEYVPRTALLGPLRPNLRGVGHRLSSKHYPVNVLKGGVFRSPTSYPKSRHPYINYRADTKDLIEYEPATKPFAHYRSTSTKQQRHSKN